MSPLPPARLNELRTLAKALAGRRRSEFGRRRSSRLRLLGIAILAMGVVLAWRLTTPCGLQRCEDRYATDTPATIAVAQAPMPTNVRVEETPSAEPIVEPVPEPQPTVRLAERPATNEIGTLLAVEREPAVAEAVRTKKASPRRPAPRQRPAATPDPQLAAVVATEPPELAMPTPTISPGPAPAVAPDRGPVANLSGHWLLTNAIDTTTHSAFAGMRIRFRLELEQHGESITGRGEKYTVDDEPLPRGQRSPIVLEGTVRGRDVLVRFLEHGTRRVSSGGFHWRISLDGKSLQGTFESTAAGTRGRSHATRDG